MVYDLFFLKSGAKLLLFFEIELPSNDKKLSILYFLHIFHVKILLFVVFFVSKRLLLILDFSATAFCRLLLFLGGKDNFVLFFWATLQGRSLLITIGRMSHVLVSCARAFRARGVYLRYCSALRLLVRHLMPFFQTSACVPDLPDFP